MENKEIKRSAAELNDDALENVSGGTGTETAYNTLTVSGDAGIEKAYETVTESEAAAAHAIHVLP